MCAAGCATSPLPPRSFQSSNDPLGCGSLDQPDKTPLAAVSDLEIVSLSEDDLPGMPEGDEPSLEHPVGVQLSFPAPQGWSQAWLERRLGCYRQLAQATGDDPLLVPGSALSVSAVRGRFVVSVVGEDQATSRQIVAAVQNMVLRSATSLAAR